MATASARFILWVGGVERIYMCMLGGRAKFAMSSKDMRGMYVAVAAATAAIAAAATASHLNNTMEHQILMREEEMQKLIAEMSEASRKYLNDVAASMLNGNLDVNRLLTREFGDFKRSVLSSLEAFITTHGVSGDEIKRVVVGVLGEEMKAANETLVRHMHALDLAAARHGEDLKGALGMLVQSFDRHNRRSQDEFAMRLKDVADTNEKSTTAAAMQAKRVNDVIRESSLHMQREFVKRLDQMMVDTKHEMRLAVQSAVSKQSSVLEEKLQQTLSKIESEKFKAPVTESEAHKKRKHSDAGNYDRQMRNALDELKAATAKILETKLEEHEKEFSDARTRGFYLGESVKKLQSNTNEVLKSSEQTRAYMKNLDRNVMNLDETIKKVGGDQFLARMFPTTHASITRT